MPVVVTGARRSWLRGGRPEPFAACFSVVGSREHAADLAGLAHEVFQDARRRSLTSGLTRTLLAVHSLLAEENAQTPARAPVRASGIAAALRPTGLYVAQMGDGLIGNARLGALWARSWEPEDLEPSDLGPSYQGPQPGGEFRASASPLGVGPANPAAPPAVTTEFFHVGPGDAYLFLPGLSGDEVAEDWLAGALSANPDPRAVSEILRSASPATAGLAVWWPQDPVPPDSRWQLWPAAPVTPNVPAPEAPPVEPRSARFRPSRPRIVALASIAILAALAIWAVARSLAPDTTVAETAALIRQAETMADRTAATALLDEAIARLQPRAQRDEQALALLNRAHSRRDRALDIIRVGEIERLALPASPSARPLGIWKSEPSVLVLDLGAQALYRADLPAGRVDVALRPGDLYAEQPLGQLVSGAYSPPRGVNTDGRLLLMDTVRSIVSVSPSGTRRWWPPDSDQWQQLGPAAATYDDLFVLDSGRGVIWQYPARVALARGTIAAATQDEPRLSQALDLATDGNLYLLLPDGTIHKLAPGGGALPFDGRVLGEPIRGAIALFAHPDLDRVWVLEPGASRVVEFTTTGDYARQYVFPPNVLRQAVGLHVDGQAQELWILTNEHVLSVKIG